MILWQILNLVFLDLPSYKLSFKKHVLLCALCASSLDSAGNASARWGKAHYKRRVPLRFTPCAPGGPPFWAGQLTYACFFENDIKLETQIYLNMKFEKPLLFNKNKKICEEKELVFLDLPSYKAINYVIRSNPFLKKYYFAPFYLLHHHFWLLKY